MLALRLKASKQTDAATLRLNSIFAACFATITIMALGEFAAAQINNRPSTAADAGVVTPHQLLAPLKAQREVDEANRLWEQGRADKAYEHISIALAAYPHYSVALALRSLLDLDAGRLEEAFADAQDAVQVDPRYAVPYFVLGSVFNRKRKYDDAISALTKAVHLQSPLWQAHYEMAYALFGKRDDRAALREIEEAIRLITDRVAPEDRARIHFWRAHVLVQLQEIPAACAEYEQSIREHPQGQFAEYSRQALSLLSHARPSAIAEIH